jgi:hypothetical protein
MSPCTRVLEDELRKEARDLLGAEHTAHEGQHVRSRGELVEDRITSNPEDLGDAVLDRAAPKVGLRLHHHERGVDVLTAVEPVHELDDPSKHRVARASIGEAVDADEAVVVEARSLLVGEGGRGHRAATRRSCRTSPTTGPR